MAILEMLAKFVEFNSEYIHARLKVHETKRHVAAGLLPAQAQRKDIEAARECGLRFKHWCISKRDAILQMLDDPARKLSPRPWTRPTSRVAATLREHRDASSEPGSGLPGRPACGARR